jgi:hypothetical protein
MHRVFYSFICLLLTCYAWAQPSFTLSGYITDSSSGEVIIGATVYPQDRPQSGTATNVYGFYSLTLPEGSHAVVYSFLGYRKQVVQLTLQRNQRLSIALQPEATALQEVTITAERSNANITSTRMSSVDLEMSQIKNLPALFGEVDVLKAIQLLPGIQSAGEGNTGLYIRGGGADQNLVLLDEAQVFNTGHLFGFVSVFNSDAIKNVTVIKGGMPARYGGRLSSVLDFCMRDGSYKRWEAEGGIGLLASRFTVHGPLLRDKASVLISARRSYLDIITRPFLRNGDSRGFPYYFYDLNAKINYRITERDQLFLSGYLGSDVLRLNVLSGRIRATLDWGNRTATLRWNRVHTARLFSNVSLLYNRFGFNAGTIFDNFDATVNSSITDYSLKSDWEYTHSPTLRLRAGGQYIFHTFTPRRTDARVSDSDLQFSNPLRNIDKYAHDAALYTEAEWGITDFIKLNAGLRGVFFAQVGAYDLVRPEPTFRDTLRFERGETVRTFQGWEPRLAATFLLSEQHSIKLGYNYNYQFIHLVSLSSNSLPFDIWVPSSALVAPQAGAQWAAGYFRNFSSDRFEASAEVFYRTMESQIEYREDYIPIITGELEREFVFGRGRAYGVELFLKKKRGRLNGWVGYTLSRTERQFDRINQGQWFLSRFDRLHDLSLVANYALSKRLDLGAVFVYGSGQPITIPQRRYLIEGQVVNEYGPRNSFRMESYHRLDLSATYHFPTRKRLEHSLTLSVYNAYNRKNPFLYFIEPRGDVAQGTLSVQAKKLYLFPILPALTWNFQF